MSRGKPFGTRRSVHRSVTRRTHVGRRGTTLKARGNSGYACRYNVSVAPCCRLRRRGTPGQCSAYRTLDALAFSFALKVEGRLALSPLPLSPVPAERTSTPLVVAMGGRRVLRE